MDGFWKSDRLEEVTLEIRVPCEVHMALVNSYRWRADDVLFGS